MLNDSSEIAPETLAIDLVEAGSWLHKEFKFKPRYKLRSLLRTAVELLGERHRQYGLATDYLSGVKDTLAALALVERKALVIFGLCLLRHSRVSRDWTRPSEVAGLCARSAIISVLRHLTGSAVEDTSNLRQILVAEAGLGLDGVLGELDLNGNVEYFSKFHMSWTRDLEEHHRFLNESVGAQLAHAADAAVPRG